MLPFAASGKTKIQYVPITRVAAGKDNRIAVGNYSTIEGHLVEGGLGGHPKIVNPPGADPIHHEYLQGETTKLVYNDAEQNWNWKNSNYMRGEFTVDSEQYEKFAAGLAQPQLNRTSPSAGFDVQHANGCMTDRSILAFLQ